MESTTKSSAINYGLYLGAILSIISVIIYAVNLDLFTEWWLGIILFVLVVVYGVVSALKSRKILDGLISFKQAFASYFITIAVGTLIATVIGIAIFTFIDPEAATYLNEQILILTKQTMERFGAPQEVIQADYYVLTFSIWGISSENEWNGRVSLHELKKLRYSISREENVQILVTIEI